MDEPDLSEAFSALTTTEYAEFLKLWPQIKDTREQKKLPLTVIFRKLNELGLITVGYTQFTRFVKRASEGSDESAETDTVPTSTPVKAATEETGESQFPQTQAPNGIEQADKSATVATTVAGAKADAIRTSTQKNYSKSVRKH